MLHILMILAVIFTLIGVVAGLLYPDACKNKEIHQASEIPSRKEDEATYKVWLATLHALERRRTNTGVTVIFAYALTMLCLIPPQHMVESGSPEAAFITVLMFIIAAPLILVTIYSMVHNERVMDIDMKRDYPN